MIYARTLYTIVFISTCKTITKLSSQFTLAHFLLVIFHRRFLRPLFIYFPRTIAPTRGFCIRLCHLAAQFIYLHFLLVSLLFDEYFFSLFFRLIKMSNWLAVRFPHLRHHRTHGEYNNSAMQIAPRISGAIVYVFVH